MKEGLSCLLTPVAAWPCWPPPDDGQTTGAGCAVWLQDDMRSQRSPACQGPQSVPAETDTLASAFPLSLGLTGSFGCALAIICHLLSSACSSPEHLRRDTLQLCTVCVYVCMCACAGGAGCLFPAPAVQEILLPEPEQEPGGRRLALGSLFPSGLQSPCKHISFPKKAPESLSSNTTVAFINFLA